MKLLKIFIRSTKEQIRDWRLLSFSFICPISFMIIIGLVMGSGYYTLPVLVWNQDKGMGTGPGENALVNYGKELIVELKNMRYETGDNIFKIQIVSSGKGIEKKLAKRKWAAFVNIPADFTEALKSKETRTDESGVPPGGRDNPELLVKGDRSNPSFSFAKMAIDAIFHDFILKKTKYDYPVTRKTIKIGVKKQGSEFDYLAPGLMLIAIFMLIIQSAVVLAREVETKTIKRLQISSLKTWEFLGGVSLTQVLFSIIMVPLMFETAVWMGFHSQGSLINGMIIGVLACISAIAIGLITAAFSRTGGEAFLIGNVVVLPIFFLSGAIFPVPDITIFRLGDFSFNLFELLPATHAADAFLQIFLYGAGLEELIYEILMIVALSAIYSWIGVLLYYRIHLKIHYRDKLKKEHRRK